MSKNKVGLVIPIFNRPQYVNRCFDSLLKLTTKPDVIVLVDDASTEELPVLSLPHKLIKHKINTGVKGALKTGIDYLIEQECNLLINLDSDAIVKPDFIQILLKAYHSIDGKAMVSGFNTINPQNPIVSSLTHGVEKAFVNGINILFNKHHYEKCIKPSLIKEGNWDYNTSLLSHELGFNFVITTPSVVQHIGLQSSMGHTGADVAQDFKQLTLPSVTLFGIDSHDKEGINRAALISQRDIEYGAVNIITDDLFTKNGTNEQRRKDYSKFMIKELTKHFVTSHVLTINADGYVVNWEAWSDDYLQYDYIGATWLYKDGMNVGNGGFSLRSKKLCDILASNAIDESLMHPEDHCICRIYRRSLEQNFGIKFAPEEVANRFSIEAYGSNAITGANRYSSQFGFHSRHVDFTGSDIPLEMQLPPVRQQQYRPQNYIHR